MRRAPRPPAPQPLPHRGRGGALGRAAAARSGERRASSTGCSSALEPRPGGSTPRPPLLRGGGAEEEVAAAVGELGADVVHVHNMQPLIGPRGARRGARRRRARGAPPPQRPAVLRDRRGVARRRALLSLPRAQHGAGARAQLPRLAARGGRLRRRPGAPPAARARLRRPLRGAQPLGGRAAGPPGRARPIGSTCSPTTSRPRSWPATRARTRAATRSRPDGCRAEKGLDVAIEAAAARRACRSGSPATARPGPSSPSWSRALSAPVELLGRGRARRRCRTLLRGAAGARAAARAATSSRRSRCWRRWAAGVPVVATRSGGVPELIGAERCAPLGDAEALAARMRELWSDPALRRRRGRAAARPARASATPRSATWRTCWRSTTSSLSTTAQ